MAGIGEESVVDVKERFRRETTKLKADHKKEVTVAEARIAKLSAEVSAKETLLVRPCCFRVLAAVVEAAVCCHSGAATDWAGGVIPVPFTTTRLTCRWRHCSLRSTT